MLDKKLLEKLYHDRKLTDKQIAERLGVNKQTVYRTRKKFNIEKLPKNDRLNLEVSEFQRQVLLGTLLGDAYISPHGVRSNRNSIIEIKHSCNIYDQSLYIEWLSSCLGNLFHSQTVCENGKKIRIRSHAHPIFNKLRDSLYGKDNIKVIKKGYLDMVTPLSLAVWYMDDGGVQNNGKTAKLSTHNFTLKENEIISEWLSAKYNIPNKIQKDGKYYWIRFNNEGALKLWRLIDKYIIQPMWYKIGDRLDNRLIYLCGPMENALDDGIAWRRKFNNELIKMGFRCIIPNDEEAEVKKHNDMPSLKTSDLNKYKVIMRDFIRADLTFVSSADFTICCWNGEVSAGTMGEATYGFYLNKPSYLVTSMSLQEIPGWFLACFTEVFSSLEELVDYLKENE